MILHILRIVNDFYSFCVINFLSFVHTRFVYIIKKGGLAMLKLQLKTLRTQKKLTQAEIADRLGIARTTYAMYEQGKREPDFATLASMADFFEVSIDELLGRPIGTGTEDAAFEAFRNDPNLEVFYKELPESDEDKVQQLKDFWEFINKKK